MEAQLLESSTVPSQEYIKSYFSALPTDSRFILNNLQKIVPSSAIDGQRIEFVLDKYEAANIYQIQDTYLKVNISIVKADGTFPTNNPKPGLTNNILHSLFESVRLYLNDYLVSTAAKDYAYKSYISTILTFPSSSKNTWLATQGYYQDTQKFMGPVASNTGWIQRRALFHTGADASKDYKASGVTLFGKVFHELMNITTGIPPNTKIKFEFQRSDDAFIIMSDAGDNEKYKIKLNEILLFVPVAQVSSQIYNEISTFWSKSENSKPIVLHYRRVEIKPFTIPKNVNDWYSSSLFSDNDLPCRIVVVFVKPSARVGNYHENPFEFRRSWELEVGQSYRNYSSTENNSLPQLLQQMEENFEKKLQETFKAILGQNLNSKKGKSSATLRPKRSKRSASKQTPPQSTSNLDPEALQRLKLYLESLEKSSNQSDSGSFYSLSRVNDDPGPSPGPAIKKKFYIKKVECQINTQSIDQFDDEASAEDNVSMYWRMFYSIGQLNTLFSAGITYDEFLNGFYFAVFDLSTSGKSGSTYVIPAIRVGHLRLRVMFNEALPQDLTMLVYSEFPSTLYLYRSGKISASYAA